VKTGYKVCDAMTNRPIGVSPETSIKECAQVMKRNNIGSVVVVDKSGRLVGHLTEQAILHEVVAKGHDASRVAAERVMAKGVATTSPEKDIFDALMRMCDLDVKQLPVMAGKRLVGILTLKDILKIQPQLFELLAEKFELREESRKPIFEFKQEGFCDYCCRYSEAVSNIRGVSLCSDCMRRHQDFLNAE